jgi:hypothetical protein
MAENATEAGARALWGQAFQPAAGLLPGVSTSAELLKFSMRSSQRSELYG